MRKLRIVLWLVVVVAVALVAMLWQARQNQTSGVVQLAPETGTFTADFELTDHNGVVQSDENFRGRWMLIFFGFTNCPDVCPMGLSTIAQVMDDLGPDAAALQPLFITIDPERDTQAALAEYVPQFGPGILGLGGTPEQIAQTAKTFKVYYEKIAEASAPDQYTMGHTSSFLLFDPQGEYVRLYDYDQDPATILADLRERIGG